MILNIPIAQWIFYGFAALAVFSAFLVVVMNNPVRCVLALVLTFLASSVLWILAQAEFLALILVLVYVGAVMTLFLFVVMMLDIEVVSMKRHFVKYLPFGLILIAVLVSLLMYAISPEFLQLPLLQKAVKAGADYNNTKALGLVLYTDYMFAFEMAAVLLLVAIIAAISLAHRAPRNCHTQDVVKQIQMKRHERVRLVSMKPETDE